MWLGSLILLLCHDILLRIVIKFKIIGAVEQTRTAEPLPYQGSALPLSYNSKLFERETGLKPATPQLGRLVLYQLSYSRNTSRGGG